jgi:hypothetical protein
MKQLQLLMLLAASMTGAAAQPHAADPDAKVPAAKYESALENYRPYREEKLAPWRELNDEVGRVGGHVGMFRGGRPGDSGKAAPAKPSAGQPAGSARKEPAGQAPARSAPAPQGGHAGH